MRDYTARLSDMDVGSILDEFHGRTEYDEGQDLCQEWCDTPLGEDDLGELDFD